MAVDNTKLGVVTFPVSRAGIVPLSNLVKILLEQSSSKLHVITGGKGLAVNNIDARVQVTGIQHKTKNNILGRIISYALTQIRMSLSIIGAKNSPDKWLFFIGGERLILPIIAAKLTRKPVILLFAGSSHWQRNLNKNFMTAIIFFISTSVQILCDKVIIYSPILISELNLEPRRHKILIAHEHFLDLKTFTITTSYLNRPPLIGYIGRLSGEKGVQHFAQALPAILNGRQNLKALIGGDGEMKCSTESSLREKCIADRVDMPGWISRDKLPQYLNRLRLIVLPSYTEGLPNIMLEAMACGTPVLATPVGAIPDIIVDGKTGFIMENNTPECIAENVLRALSSPDLERIAEAGRRFVVENFTFDKTVKNWKRILEEI